MRNSSPRNSADYAGNVISRATFTTADDSQLLQELTIALFTGEVQKTIEHFHPYGFTTVPLPPSQATGVQAAAEAIIAFVSSNRSHGVALMVADRRHRLGDLQPGEIAHHDDQTHQRVIHRDGVYDSAPNSKLHQQRIQKPSDTVTGGLNGLASPPDQDYGQTAWKPKIPHSYKHHDASLQQHEHPQTINHHVIQGDAIPPNVSGGATGILSQIAGLGALMSQVSGVAGIGPTLTAMSSQISSLVGQLSGAGASGTTTLVANKLATAAQAIADGGGSTSQLTALASQLMSLLGGSQIVHKNHMNIGSGILHSVFADTHSHSMGITGRVLNIFKGAHVHSINSNGLSFQTIAGIVHKAAQSILHNAGTTHTTQAGSGAYHNSPNTYVEDVLTVGDITNSPVYTNASDERLKANIVDHPAVLDKILALRVKKFDEYYVHRQPEGITINKTRMRPLVGFIAQDVRNIIPEVVYGDEEKDFLSVSENKIGVLHIAAFQEFVAESRGEIATLRARIAELEAAHG